MSEKTVKGNAIRLRGIRQNNLKSLDIDLPLGSLVAVTGVSGSGKSSLAFDTLYAEGQRRYIESFSTYARQFLDRMDKPLVDSVHGIPPAIAIDQSNPVKNSRSTVGTMTELTDHVKLLFAKAATLHCRGCGSAVERDDPESIARKLLEASSVEAPRAMVSFPFFRPERASDEEVASELAKLGFGRRITATGAAEPIELPLAERTNILVDRLRLGSRELPRIRESLEQALHYGKGRASVWLSPDEGPAVERRFSDQRHCPACDIAYMEPSSNLFSFNSPLGACATCKGFGRTISIDLDLVVPDPRRSIREGAVKPWTTASYAEGQEDLIEFCRRRKIPVDRPWRDLTPSQRELVVEGDPGFYGIRGFFQWLEGKTYKMHIRVLLSKYRSYRKCEDCGGARFQPETLLYRLSGKTIAEIYALDVSSALAFVRELDRPAGNSAVVTLLLEEIENRLDYLERVGLSYLTLDRQSRTLSGGEVQRVDLTTALGSSLVNSLYVLDEPSIGLHPRDTSRLMDILKRLRDADNTIVVVEHDAEVIRRTDHVLDLGPGPGARGGRVVYFGPTSQLTQQEQSLTAQYLAGRKSIPTRNNRREPTAGYSLVVRGARENNLKGTDFEIPLGLFVAVTGVSGSGKSTLVNDVLYRAYRRSRGEAVAEPGATDAIDGFDKLRDMVLVDQSPLGRTPRANPATYTKAYDEIRRLFARTKEARRRGYAPSTFSFNVDGGRCPLCSGDGFERIEMQFLSDVLVSCESCGGARFKKDVLEITYRGKNIHDVLSMTLREAMDFFSDRKKIVTPLRGLVEVGLSYLRLGQPLSTLSGGEAQRLKLAVQMSSADDPSGILFLFDEPTTGLHFEDIRVLLEAFAALARRGASILVIEHNLDVIKNADWILDLGPEGGRDGGRLVAAGPPESIVASGTHTGRFLEPYLAGLPPAIEPVPLPRRPPSENVIKIRGARQHNLRHVDVDIPRDQIVVLTGLSGSGKSSLAFDIVFAEGQRRFLESLSVYARQYIQVLDKPEVDLVSGMPPTIAIEQRLTRGGRKSTVATVTEVYHYLRLLFSKIGVQHCVHCNIPVTPQTEDQMFSDIASRFQRKRIGLYAPLIRARKGAHREVIERARREGFTKLRIDGRLVTTAKARPLRRYVEHDIEALVATLDLAKVSTAEARAETDRALAVGKGAILVLCGKEARYYNRARACPRCETSYQELDPRLFSFNSRFGACPECDGLGFHEAFDPELLVPDDRLSLKEGALAVLDKAPRRFPGLTRTRLSRRVRALAIDPERPWRRIAAAKRRALLYGAEGSSGLVDWLNEIHEDARGETATFLHEFRSERRCSACGGARLRAQSRYVRLGGLAIHEVAARTPSGVLDFLERIRREELATSARSETVASSILKELSSRLRLLRDVGLSYLALSRAATTLSGGEAQRVRLAAQLGSRLRGVCYVLDEPTIGLHVRDNRKLLLTLRALAQAGNSVLIVEHDEDTIRSADHVIDLGPGGGLEGGQIVAQGSPSQILENPASVTGRWLRKRQRRLPPPVSLREVPCLEVRSARANNLKGIDVRFPIGRLTVVTGVSGSGKSSLVREVLLNGVRKAMGARVQPGDHDEILGVHQLKYAREVDQSPIGKTPRSIPASYVGFFDEIRKLFARTPEARMAGFGPGRFSFNVKGGRCEACAGQGTVKMEMSFLPNVYVHCESCQGRRYNEETLAVTYRGKTIHDVLTMTLNEAQKLFAPIPSIHRPLELMNAIGLSYLTLGQPSNTLSGGEAQRIKLAYELAKPSGGQTLYVLDEPTTGLHLADIERLVKVLRALVETGNTVVVIEHNLDVVAEADVVVDLGPEGGEAGGELVFWGPPATLRTAARGHTGRYLDAHLRGTTISAAS